MVIVYAKYAKNLKEERSRKSEGECSFNKIRGTIGKN